MVVMLELKHFTCQTNYGPKLIFTGYYLDRNSMETYGTLKCLQKMEVFEPAGIQI